MSKDVPVSHPRYQSLMLREKIVEGVSSGITSPHGLLAHGRGEAFDYLLGERTHPFAEEAISASAALLLLAKHPVLSVNGNVVALVPDEMAQLADALRCPLEVNIFNASLEREQRMAEHLRKHGATNVLLPVEGCFVPGLESNRRRCHPDGIFRADLIFVPLEDGDRAEALQRAGKKVITVDLNPASRTAQAATITIVDNLVRVVPLLISKIESKRNDTEAELQKEVSAYSPQRSLKMARQQIVEGFSGGI